MIEPSKTDAAKKDEAGIDPQTAQKIAKLRSALRENFGTAVLALMNLPRYGSQTLPDLQHLILDPMLNDRVAFAFAGPAAQNEDGKISAEDNRDTTGFVIWASVSEEVDASIRKQIQQGVFPIRLKPNEWNCGNIHWLLDIVTPSPKAAASVIANFRQVAKEGELRLHPVISRLVDPALLEKMGARKTPGITKDPAQVADQ